MFSKSKTPPDGGSTVPTPPSSGAFSVIGGDVEIDGSIAADGDLHIDGAVRGDVRCNAIVLGESGKITGNIAAEDAKLSGTVEGNVDVGTLTVLAAARMKGDVRYDTLSVEAGARTEGSFSHRGSGEGRIKLVETGE